MRDSQGRSQFALSALAVLAVAALLTATFALVTQRSPISTSTLTNEESDVALLERANATERELFQVRQRLRDLEAEVGRNRARTEADLFDGDADAGGGNPSESASGHPDPAPSPTKAADEAYRAQIELLEEAVASEPIDGAWARAAVVAIENKYRGTDAMLDRANISTVCRSTLCRVDVTFASPEEAEPGTRAMMTASPWPSIGFTRVDTDRGVTTHFIAREGQSLPVADSMKTEPANTP